MSPAASPQRGAGEPPDDVEEEDERPLLSRAGRIALVALCLVAAVLAALYAGQRFAPPAAAPSAGSVRLGPDPGEVVGAYLARLPGTLPVPGADAYALVQLRASHRVEDVPTVVGDLPVSRAVFRVGLPRVQTALRFVDTPGAAGPGTPGAADAPGSDAYRTVAALRTAQGVAAHAAAADASRLGGRQGAVAAAEERALSGPDCACVVALVVRGDRAKLEALAAAPEVRAVHAAPAGTTLRELALSPLLPEQVDVAGPLPDDGPVP